MVYVFVVIISALFLGAYEVLKKVSLKQSRVEEVLFFYCLSGFLISLFFINDAVNVDLINIIFILLKSGIIVVNWLLVAKCMAKLDVGIVVTFSLLNTILVVFASNIFFKEVITWVHLLSLFFISLGIYLVTKLENKEKEKKIEYKYIVYLILASVLGTCSALLDKYLLNIKEIKYSSILVWFMLFNTIIYGCIYFVKNKKIEIKKLKTNYWMILTGVFIVLADVSYYYSIAMDGAQLSIISILRKFSVIVATILSSIFLKEKKLLQKLMILLIMLLGVALPIFNK